MAWKNALNFDEWRTLALWTKELGWDAASAAFAANFNVDPVWLAQRQTWAVNAAAVLIGAVGDHGYGNLSWLYSAPPMGT